MKGLVFVRKKVLTWVALTLGAVLLVATFAMAGKDLPRWVEVGMSVIWAAIALAVPVNIFIGGAVEKVRQARENRRWLQEHNPGVRARCVTCRYCKTRVYHPFSTPAYRNAMTSVIPVYCKRFRVSLSYKPEQRCVAEVAWQAVYEKSDAVK